jgi:hypothetical protein
MIENEMAEHSLFSNKLNAKKAVQAERIIPADKVALNNDLPYTCSLITTSMIIQKTKNPGIAKSAEKIVDTKTVNNMGPRSFPDNNK